MNKIQVMGIEEPEPPETLCNMKKLEKNEESTHSLKKQLMKKLSVKRLKKKQAMCAKKKLSKIKKIQRNIMEKKYSFQDFSDEVPKLSSQGEIYFKCLYELLDYPFETEELEETTYFNVLNEIQGQEFFLSTIMLSRKCLQLIILRCKNSTLIRKFIENYNKDLYVICIDLGGAFITQALLVACLQFIQNKEKSKRWKHDCDFFEKWVIKVADYCLENLEDFIFHENNSTYVMRTLLFVLSGKPIDPDDIRDIRRFFKNQSQIQGGKSLSRTTQEQCPDTPEGFNIRFKSFVNKLSTNNVPDIMRTEKGGPIIEVLLFTLHANDHKLCQEVIMKISNLSFKKLKTELVSEIFNHKYASFVVQRIVELANCQKRRWLWDNFFAEQFYQLCISVYTKSNTIAQKIICGCRNKKEFHKIFAKIEPMIEELIKLKTFALLSKLAMMCKNFRKCQERFLKAMMISMNCYRPLERQVDIATLLLNFESYEVFHKRSVPRLRLTLNGSLIIQYTLQFRKPLKIVNSLLSMPAEFLLRLGRSCEGYQIFDALFKCPSFKESSQIDLITKMKPHLTEMACKHDGSLCLQVIWKEASITIKTHIIEELSKSAELLKDNQYGVTVYERFDMYNFQTHYEKWEILQSLMTKKRKFNANLSTPQLSKKIKEIM